MGWFLYYDRDFCHERVNLILPNLLRPISGQCSISIPPLPEQLYPLKPLIIQEVRLNPSMLVEMFCDLTRTIWPVKLVASVKYP